jgi:protein-tyrosine phosphatase
VLAAVVLSLLGVPDEEIVDDYALSRLGMDRMVEWLKANSPEAMDVMAAQPTAFLQAPPAAMLGLLEWVSAEYGSMRDFVAHAGVHEEIIDAIRCILVEPAGGS